MSRIVAAVTLWVIGPFAAAGSGTRADFAFQRHPRGGTKNDEVIDRIQTLYAEKTEVVKLRMTGGNRDGCIRWGRGPLAPCVRTMIESRERLAKQD